LNPELQRALDKIDVEAYLDREAIDYRMSHGTRGLQLNLQECPFCHGTGRKTYVNAESGLGNCFHGSCSTPKFNLFKLIRGVSGLAGPALDEHIFSVAAEQGWLPKKARVEIVKRDLALPSKTTSLPLQTPAGPRNLRYLEERGVPADVAAYFNLAYCKGGWYRYEAEGAEKFVSFDRRVIIPITDLAGTLVSFQGRDTTGKQLPKYLFPAGFAVAGSHLFNAQNFQNGVTRHVIVGEGAFDTIATHMAIDGQAGFDSVLPIATFGMHLSGGPDGQVAKFVELRDRGLELVTFMWDGSRDALAASVKSGLTLMGVGLKVRIARLPLDKDPNEVPPATVRDAFYKATSLSRLSAVRLLTEIARL
jgi:DNA primase